MLGKKNPLDAIDLFRSQLDQILNSSHELVILSNQIEWKWIEEELKDFYSTWGRPSVPLRCMVGLLLLKQLYNHSDESVIDRWVENPYWQYFTGEKYFQHKAPFDPSDFVHFRKRIGESGMEKILGLTIKLHKGAAEQKEVQIDTTVQKKNITYPTDAKLQIRIMEYLRWIAKEEKLILRQSYLFVVKDLKKKMHNGQHPANRKRAQMARRKIKTICGRMLRDVERKLSQTAILYYRPWLDLYWQVWSQKRNDKNKIYSLHEPQVNCISKGKEHIKYEFGNKVALTKNRIGGVIVGVKSFEENIFDGHSLEPALEQCERIRKSIGGNRPEEAVVDRGCKGRKEINGTQISIPGKSTKNMTQYEKRKIRNKFKARASIEPIIGHLKHDHRMLINYLSGSLGDAVNALLAGAAFNLKMKLNEIKRRVKEFLHLFYFSIQINLNQYLNKKTLQLSLKGTL